MVDGISSAVPGAIAFPGTGNQTRTAILEAAFPGLRVLGRAADPAEQDSQPPAGKAGATKPAVAGGQKPALASGDTLLTAQQQGATGATDGDGRPKVPGELTDEEKQQVAKLKQIDAKVRAHERAHAAVGGQYAGAPHYGYSRGPDGQQYATSGEVSIDIGPERDPNATLQKAAQVQAAALAPADPSGQDRAVAAAAAQLRLQALTQIREEKRTEAEQQEAGQQKAGQAGEARLGGVDSVAATGGQAAPAASPAAETPAARASRAYANDNAGLNRLVGQVVGISA